VREQSSRRSDERTIGGAKPRTPLLTSQNRELVPQEHELHVLGELGSTAADEQPQNCGKGKVGEGEEHRGILSRTGRGLLILARRRGFWCPRARVKHRMT
jgi:hypothetical protein